MASDPDTPQQPGAPLKLASRRWPLILQNRRLWLGALLGVACLVLAMADIDYVELAAALRSAHPAWIAVAAMTVLLTGVVKAWRWRLLLYPERHQRIAGALHLPRLVNIWLAGTAVNLALPAPRAGDILRVYLAGETGDVSKSQVLGTIAAEKLLDMLMLALCFVGLLLFMAMPQELMERQPSTLGISGLVLVVVVGLLWQRHRVVALASRVLRHLPYGAKMANSLERGLDGMAGLSRPSLLIGLAALTVGIWFLSVLTNYVMLLALGMPTSWMESLFVLVVLQVGVALPSTPGKIGLFQVLCLWALGIFGVSTALGLAYGVLLYLVAPLLLMLVGAAALGIEGWRMGRLPGSLELELSHTPVSQDTAASRGA